MAFILKDRVLETSDTTGTGSFTLSGAVTGFVTFSGAIGNTNTTYYTIENPNTTEWEVGIGTVSAGSISRDTVLASSTGSKVSFTGGTKNVFCDYPATKSVYQDASGVVTVPSLVATTSLNATGTVSFNGLQGTAGQVLQSNGTGTTPTWVASPAAGAGGSNTQIQYNNSGVLAGNSTYTMVSGVMKENGYNFVSQADVGSNPSQIPLNQYLGSMAYEDKAGVILTGDAKINTLTVGLGSGSISTNTAVGKSALVANTTGDSNTAIGFQAGFANTTGNYNTSLGAQALQSTTSGSGNVAIGFYSMLSNTNGQYNVAIGPRVVGSYVASLASNTSGTFNIGIGVGALGANTTSSGSIGIGFQALSVSTGGTNTAFGYLSGSTVTTGTNNLLLGYNAQASAATVSNEITIGNSSNTVIRYPHSYSTVASLPSASTVGRGSRTFVTDALAPVFQAIVTGGGAVFTPVYSDGTNWKIG